MKRYITNCVSSTCEAITDMIENAEDITREEFEWEVDEQELKEMEESLSYGDDWIWMKDDWHVSYHKSEYKGEPCVYFRHSSIEYIYV